MNSLKVNAKHHSILYPFVLCLYFFCGHSIAFGFFSKEEKEFKVSSCLSCSSDGCKNNNDITGFKVTSNQVLVFARIEGVERIFSYPTSSEMQCVILRERNFSFDCKVHTIYQWGGSFSSDLVFDGKSRLTMSSSSSSSRLNLKQTCNVK